MNTRIFGAALIVLMAGLDALAVPILGPNGNYYEYIPGPLEWADALVEAETKSFLGKTGYLATITDQTEQDFVFNFVIQGQGFAWGGASDIESEGTWKWVTGPEAGTVFWDNGVGIGYSNWSSGNPSGGAENHLMLNWPFATSNQWNDANAGPYGYVVEFTIPEPTTLALVDIKPGSDPNSINLKSNGVLPIAILSTDEFDVSEVDIDTLLFGDPLLLDNGGTAVSPLRSAFEDVNDDGFVDLTPKFSIPDLVEYEALGPHTLEGLLTGETVDGIPFSGMDSIRIVPPNGSNGNGLKVSNYPNTGIVKNWEILDVFGVG